MTSILFNNNIIGKKNIFGDQSKVDQAILLGYIDPLNSFYYNHIIRVKYTRDFFFDYFIINTFYKFCSFKNNYSL